jgi:hypothetical protein
MIARKSLAAGAFSVLLFSVMTGIGIFLFSLDKWLFATIVTIAFVFAWFLAFFIIIIANIQQVILYHNYTPPPPILDELEDNK